MQAVILFDADFCTELSAYQAYAQKTVHYYAHK